MTQHSARVMLLLCAALFVAFPGTGVAQAPPAGSENESLLPVADDLLPIRNRMVTVALRDTPLRDALYSIAESVGLNLVLEKGVDPALPLTLTIKNISAEDALSIILDAAGYFHELRGNVLHVRELDTVLFEFGQPSVVQSYTVDIGGDILGAAIESTRGFSESGGSGGGGSGGTQDMTGLVKQEITSDQQAFDFWDAIERALREILNIATQNNSEQSDTSRQRSYFTINRMTGTVSVTARKSELDLVTRYLGALRQALKRQVIIEARVIEVSMNKGLQYGIDWNWLVDSDITISGNNFAGTIQSSSPNMEVHITRGDFEGLIRAIESQGKVRVLSNPRLNIMNGQTALLSVGQSQSFISQVISDVSTGDNPVITYTTETASVLSGVMLGIVPYINEKGVISMTITPIISDLLSLEEKEIGADGTTISLPTVALRQLSTTVQVESGQTIVIGGLIQNQKKTDTNSVPFIGKLPLIGKLFTSFEDSDTSTDIVMFIKPVAAL